MSEKPQPCSCPAPTMIRATGSAQPGRSGTAFGELRRREAIAALLGIGLLPLIGGGPALSTQSDVPLIVLDPGHGGHDPGAIGLTGLLEKHIALDTAKALKLALDKSGRYRVMLTRDQDVFIPLDQRRSVADAQAASLFVSLHADALHDHAVRGASVYTSSLEASDGQSDELAQRENSVDPAAMAEYRSYSPRSQISLPVWRNGRPLFLHSFTTEPRSCTVNRCARAAQPCTKGEFRGASLIRYAECPCRDGFHIE